MRLDWKFPKIISELFLPVRFVIGNAHAFYFVKFSGCDHYRFSAMANKQLQQTEREARLLSGGSVLPF